MRSAGRIILLVFLCFLFSRCGGGDVDDREPTLTEEPSVANDNNAFALDLYTVLGTQEGNLFFSPHSISTALAMAYAGARGNTATQMSSVLHFNPIQKQFHSDFKKLLDVINKSERKRGYEIYAANAMWGQKDYGFLKNFLRTVMGNYGTGLQEVNFILNPKGARKKINDWVEKETRGKITNLIPQGVINPWTRLVLTNAIYFKGDWASKFDRTATADAPFFLDDKRSIEVPMMMQQQIFNYMETETLQILELPYRGEDLSMIILLPKKVDGLADLEKSLTLQNLKQWLSQLQVHTVTVYLPKFEMETQFNLAKQLASMGMPDAFVTLIADFSGINGKRDLFIQEVCHKAFVDVYEEGTEAAAATGVSIACGARTPPPPATFRADHPFLFMIVDNRSGSILFLGRLMNPKG